MSKAVYDANILVSVFLTGNEPGGLSNELLQLARQGAVELCLSPEIITQTPGTSIGSQRLQTRYTYDVAMAAEFCGDLRVVATPVIEPPPTPGAVPRDPDDDKIVACAMAADAEYLVTRDRDLMSLGNFGNVQIIRPEDFLRVVRRLG